MSDMPDMPAASVILIASDGTAPLKPILSRLRAQSVASALELVLAAPSDTDSLQRALSGMGFWGVRAVEADLSTSARARCAAIRAARAPVILLAEDHAFPVADTWAERLIHALDGPFAAAGPVIENANPNSAISWAVMAIEYGPWVSGDTPYEADFIPGHNSAYRRAVFEAFDNRLEELMEAEYMLHREMRTTGARLMVDPTIRIGHVNHSKVVPAVVLVCTGGRVFAATRAADWSPVRRAAYALAFPAIGAVRFARMLRALWSVDTARKPPATAILSCALLAVANALGEGLGYAFGAGAQRRTYANLEYARWRHIRTGEMEVALSG
ncbi:MAG: hypothetical protein AAFX45_04160 [Pseudomonadota bacterium]